jgi:hypothetical protein
MGFHVSPITIYRGTRTRGSRRGVSTCLFSHMYVNLSHRLQLSGVCEAFQELDLKEKISVTISAEFGYVYLIHDGITLAISLSDVGAYLDIHVRYIYTQL